MTKQWIVVDTNVFCFAGYQAAGDENARERDYLYKGSDACDFLDRMVEYCDEYGLAVDEDDPSLIIEEYQQKIPLDSFGYWAFRQLTTRIPGKTQPFRHKNPNWLDHLEDAHELDRHDRRFLATAVATPNKVLVSEDTVFLKNAQALREQGVRIYGVEEANTGL